MTNFVADDVNVTWGPTTLPNLGVNSPQAPLVTHVAPIARGYPGVAAAAATYAAMYPDSIPQRFVDRDNSTFVRLAFQVGPDVADFQTQTFPVPQDMPVHRDTGALALTRAASRWPIALAKAVDQLNHVALLGPPAQRPLLRPIVTLRDALQALTGQPVAAVPVTLAAERAAPEFNDTLRERAAAATLPGHSFDRVLVALVRTGRGGVGIRDAAQVAFMRDYGNATRQVHSAAGTVASVLGGLALHVRAHDGSFDQYLTSRGEYAFLAGASGGTELPKAVRLFDPADFTYDPRAIAQMRANGSFPSLTPTDDAVPTPAQLAALPRRPGGAFDVPWDLARQVISYVVL